MAIYYGVGGAVVNEAEYEEKLRSQTFKRLAAELKQSPRATFDIGGRAVSAKAAVEPEKEPGIPFTDIEYGKPLAIEIRWAYTGSKPKKSWGGRKKDMLLTSAFKSLATFNQAPRAVNLLRRGVEAGNNIRWSAIDKGMPLAFYTRAVSELASTATFEMVFDEFPDDTLSKLGDAVVAASGVPLFAAQSIYLLAAGSLLKLFARAGHTVFDGDVAFRSSETITFLRPGSPRTKAGFMVLTQETLSDDFLRTLTIGPEGQLLDAQNQPYSGEWPYIVISLDGAEVAGYSEFTPTAATAALLDKFFALKEGLTHPVDEVVEGLKLYSDFRFRTQAEERIKDIGKLDEQDKDYQDKKVKLEKEVAALLANITHDELRLPKKTT